MEIEKKLLNMKAEIETAKNESSKLEGQIETLQNNLKNDYGCDDIEQAETKMESMGTEIDKLNNELETGVKELEEKHDWKTV